MSQSEVSSFFLLILVFVILRIKAAEFSESFTCHSKRKLADHKFKEKEGSTRNVGRRCTGCYAKRRAQQSREASRAAAKKVKTFCSDCEKFFCLECFNDKHYAME